MNPSDFAQRIADKLVAQLKEGTAPWQKPWAEGLSFSPYNPTTGNRYRGINILALISTDFSDPRWMTYRQAQAQGWQVRGGSDRLRYSTGFGKKSGSELDRMAAGPGQPEEGNQGFSALGATKSDYGGGV